MSETLALTSRGQAESRAGLCILLVGETARSEFAGCAEPLEQAGTVLRVPTIDKAVELLASGRFAPDLVILTQAYPGQLAPPQLEPLRRLAPLSPIVLLLGTWCEGEMRSGRPLPGTVRLYWHQWHSSAPRQLARLCAGRPCAWALPPTATLEERLLSDIGPSVPTAGRLVAIQTWRFEVAEWLSDACRTAGCASVWVRPCRPVAVEGAALVLFDGTDFTGAELERLAEVSRTMPAVPVVALADFPRVEDCRRIAVSGASVVLSKPVDAEDLLWVMGTLVTPGAPEGHSGQNSRH